MTGFKRHHSRVHAEIAISEITIIGRDLKGIESLRICYRTYLAVIYTDRHSWQRLTTVVSDIPRHRAHPHSVDPSRDGNKVALNITSTVYLRHDIIDHLCDPTLTGMHVHLRPCLGKVGAIDEVEPCLLLNGIKNRFHRYPAEINTHLPRSTLLDELRGINLFPACVTSRCCCIKGEDIHGQNACHHQGRHFNLSFLSH